jgi:hypothetical protein
MRSPSVDHHADRCGSTGSPREVGALNPTSSSRAPPWRSAHAPDCVVNTFFTSSRARFARRRSAAACGPPAPSGLRPPGRRPRPAGWESNTAGKRRQSSRRPRVANATDDRPRRVARVCGRVAHRGPSRSTGAGPTGYVSAVPAQRAPGFPARRDVLRQREQQPQRGGDPSTACDYPRRWEPPHRPVARRRSGRRHRPREADR